MFGDCGGSLGEPFMEQPPIVVAVPLLFDASKTRDIGDQLRSALRRRSLSLPT